MRSWDKHVFRTAVSALMATVSSGACAEARQDETAGAVGMRSGSARASVTLSKWMFRPVPVATASIDASRGLGRLGAAGFTGRWTQRSSSTESILASRLKLVPRTGGGVGMDTRSVMEYAPVRVDRSMTLEVRPDGSYLWAIQLRKPHGQGCFMTTRQEKKGRLSASGDKVTFITSGGTQSTANSCTGRTDSAAVPAMSETYTFSRAGNALRLRGTGGVDWTFTGG